MRNTIKLKKYRRIAFWLPLFALIFFMTVSQTQAQTKRRTVKPKVQRATVQITKNGYQPSSLRLKRGVPARITFLRKTDATCAKEVVISAYGINRNLPLNKAVVVSFTPNKTGEFTFACGMNMVRGKLIVQ